MKTHIKLPLLLGVLYCT